MWLRAELPLLVRRVGKRGNRPLLKAGDPETVLQNLMTTRYPVYALADITIESRDVPHEVIVAEIVERSRPRSMYARKPSPAAKRWPR